MASGSCYPCESIGFPCGDICNECIFFECFPLESDLPSFNALLKYFGNISALREVMESVRLRFEDQVDTWIRNRVKEIGLMKVGDVVGGVLVAFEEMQRMHALETTQLQNQVDELKANLAKYEGVADQIDELKAKLAKYEGVAGLEGVDGSGVSQVMWVRPNPRHQLPRIRRTRPMHEEVDGDDHAMAMQEEVMEEEVDGDDHAMAMEEEEYEDGDGEDEEVDGDNQAVEEEHDEDEDDGDKEEEEDNGDDDDYVPPSGEEDDDEY